MLVQMIVSLFVNRTYRDFGDRPFKSYFTTNRPTFLMTEWQSLTMDSERFLAGMMVRKNQKEDNDTEELEMYTFTGSYSEWHVSMTLTIFQSFRQDGNKKILKRLRRMQKSIWKRSAGMNREISDCMIWRASTGDASISPHSASIKSTIKNGRALFAK